MGRSQRLRAILGDRHSLSQSRDNKSIEEMIEVAKRIGIVSFFVPQGTFPKNAEYAIVEYFEATRLLFDYLNELHWEEYGRPIDLSCPVLMIVDPRLDSVDQTQDLFHKLCQGIWDE